MKKIRLRTQNRFFLNFEGEQIARISDLGGTVILWRTKGGKYVVGRKFGKHKEYKVYDSAKEAASLIIDRWGKGGRRLINAAKLKDKAFEDQLNEE